MTDLALDALRRELADTQRAAISMLLGMAEAIASTPEGREDLARGFEDAAAGADPVTARLARQVAQVAGMIRERARRASQAEDDE